MPSSTPAVVGHESVQRTGLWCVVSAVRASRIESKKSRGFWDTKWEIRTWFSTVVGEETSYMRVSKKRREKKKTAQKQPSIWGILLVEKIGKWGNYGVNHPCRSKKRNDKRTYMRIYVYTYIICIMLAHIYTYDICIYRQKIKDSLFNATILEICAERHKKTHTVQSDYGISANPYSPEFGNLLQSIPTFTVSLKKWSSYFCPKKWGKASCQMWSTVNRWKKNC